MLKKEVAEIYDHKACPMCKPLADILLVQAPRCEEIESKNLIRVRHHHSSNPPNGAIHLGVLSKHSKRRIVDAAVRVHDLIDQYRVEQSTQEVSSVLSGNVSKVIE